MQITPSLIKERLLSNLESVLPHLFPNGKVFGHEFRVGSVDGEAGKKGHGSVAVEMRGAKRGVWQDFSYTSGEKGHSGDILELWCAAKGQTFKEAFPEMKRYAGFTQIEPIEKKPKPIVPKKGISRMTEPVRKYLNGRGIKDETLKKYRVRSHKRYSKLGNSEFMLFPFIDTENEPVMIKSTGIEKIKGRKDIWTSDKYYTLWGWWLVGDNDREIIICEGEIDAMSLYQINPGIPVLSLPSGVSNMTWIQNDWEALQRFERIYLVFDNDDPHPTTGLRPGEEAAKVCAKRLGLARCYRVPIPLGINDVNAVINDGDETVFDWQGVWQDKAYTFDPPTIAGAGEFREEAKARLARQKKFREENSFIWPKVPFQFRNGEMTVISGYPEGGKSAWIYQTHTHEMLNGEIWFMASFEIPPDAMIIQIAHCLFGRVPTPEDLDVAIDWMIGKLYFFRVSKTKKTEFLELIADLDYACQRFGCTRLVIDSLHFIVRKEDYEAQDNVSISLSEFAKVQDVHVGLVCHSKIKDIGEDKVPGQAQVEGSGGITKPPDNGVSIWRNIGKDAAIEKAKEMADQERIEKAFKLHDGIMSFWKNKETGKHPHVRMWFDENGKSFRLKQDDEVWAPLADKTKLEEDEEEEMF